jgi:predicted RNA-binding protein
LIPIIEDNWGIINRENIYGAPENSVALNLIKREDNIIFYIVKKDSKNLEAKLLVYIEPLVWW